MAAGWSPWLSVFLQQRQRVADGWNSGTFTLWHVPSICYQMFFHPDVHGSAPLYIATVALACCAALLVAAWRGSAGHWCVCCLAVVPFALITLASCVSSNLMVPRYMAFLQPFLLIAVAAALGKIPFGWLRNVAAYLAVSAGLLLHADFVDSLDIPHRPGAIAAAAYINAHRRPGEPLIGCSPLVGFPTQFHLKDRQDWHIYSNRAELPHYAGGPVIMEGEILSDRDMDALRAERAWVITSSGRWARWRVHIPSWWIKTDEQRFREVYAFQNDVRVVCYSIPKRKSPTER